MDHTGSHSRRGRAAEVPETEPDVSKQQHSQSPSRLRRAVWIFAACLALLVLIRSAQFSGCSVSTWQSLQIRWSEFKRESRPALAKFAAFGLFRPTSGSEHFDLIYEILSTSLGGVVLDVGANEAGITIFSAILGHRVHAVEALPVNQRIVSALACLNGVSDKITLHPFAASDNSNEVLCFRGTGSNPIPHWIGEFDQQYNGQALGISGSGKVCEPGQETIVTKRIDEMVAEDLRLLKIDVEGFEAIALRGADKLFAKHRIDYVLSELSPCNMPPSVSAEEYLKSIQQHGYDLYLEKYHDKATGVRVGERTSVQEKFVGGELVRRIEMGAMQKGALSVQLIPTEKIGTWLKELGCASQVDVLFHRR